MDRLLLFNEYYKINYSNYKDFSFSNWLVESAISSIRAKVSSMSNEEALKKAQLIMELVKQKLYVNFPLFRPFMKIMPPIPLHGAGSVGPDGIGTMSTSGRAIYYDPKFVVLTYEQGKIDFFNGDSSKFPSGIEGINGKRHPMDYALFVLVHEILHNSLKHFLREPKITSQYLSKFQLLRLWNISADFEINHILKDDSTVRQICKIYPGGIDADDPDLGIPEEEKNFFKNSSAEKIFFRLLKNIEETRKKEQTNNQEQNQSNTNDDELKVGDPVYLKDSNSYGKVISISGEEIEIEEISKEEAESLLNK